MSNKPRPVGRPKTQGEIADVRHELKFKPSEFARLEEIERATGVRIGTYIKRVLRQELERIDEDGERDGEANTKAALTVPAARGAGSALVSSSALPSMSALLAEAAQSGELAQALAMGGERLPVLGRAPCGPFREVVSEVEAHHVLSPATAEWLEAGPRDVFIVCDGQSMEGAGIPNGALLLLRTLPQGGRPQAGEVALVQIFDDEGNCSSTLKRWIKSEPLVLHDGDGNAVELPANLREAVPVAVARGIVSRI